MKIAIVSKNPPGGRCTLYGIYAKTIADRLGALVETVFPASDAAVQPPALTIDGRVIVPSDGLILSPQDIRDGLGPDGSPELLERLEEAETRFMDACEASS